MSKNISPLGVGVMITVIVGAIYFFGFPSKSSPKGPLGWDDLAPCSVQTSIDSKKELTLSDDFRAIVTDTHGTKLGEGKWSLVNAEHHIYNIDALGAKGAYVAVSPPDSDSCMLGAITRDPNHIDLRRSWFSLDTSDRD